jgi:hypothetical protein
VVVPITDWLLGELIRIFGKSDPETALNLVNGLTDRLIPLVEEMDGDVLVLKPGASCREELRLVLYKRYPERTARAQLYEWVKNQKRKNIDVTLNRMAKAREIHMNTDGVLLSTLGLAETEALISKSLP